VAASDNFYSNFVNWSKILLPLAALALLSTLFLFAKGRTDDSAIPYAEIEEIARDPRLTKPHFSGLALNGNVMSISADSARLDPVRPNVTLIEHLAAQIDTTDGAHIEISAGKGEIDGTARTARLTDLVRLTTSSRYVMETTGIIADMDSGRITSTGPLEVQAPYGQLTAGGMVIETREDGPGQQIVFNNGVRLIYQPQQ
jgi:lipopolysaccharide export system protein LptC